MPDREKSSAVAEKPIDWNEEAFVQRLGAAMILRPTAEERKVMADARLRLARLVGSLREVEAEVMNLRDEIHNTSKEIEIDRSKLDVSDFEPGMFVDVSGRTAQGTWESVHGAETSPLAEMGRWVNSPLGDELSEVIRQLTSALKTDEELVERNVCQFLREAGPEVRSALAAHLGVEVTP